MTPPPVPMHPEPVVGDPGTLRWTVPATTLDFVGVPERLPAALQRLVDEQVLVSVRVEPAAVHTTLASGESWRTHGGRVREALQQALDTPDQWRPADGRASADDLLGAVVQQVLGSEVGDYIRSHGGQVRLIRAHDHEVEVQLSGACAHCPASDVTLTDRLETGIRALYPDLRRLTSHAEPGVGAGRRMLRLLPTRPRSAS